MINIGFIGLGIMGRSQVAAFAQLRRCKIVAGCDVSDEARKAFAQAYPKAALYADHKELLADESVDAVVVALPTYHHEQACSDGKATGPIGGCGEAHDRCLPEDRPTAHGSPLSPV